jgi:hypothetical protein
MQNALTFCAYRNIINVRTRKRGETMAPKKAGRPPSDETMTDRLFVRVNKETLDKLNECTQELELSRSDVVRKGIDMVHESLKR